MSAVLHQGLFTLIALVAVAEASLTAFLLAKGIEAHRFPSHKYHDLLIFFLVSAGWTIFFGGMYTYWIISQALHFLASVAVSIWWLCLTSVIWGTAAGLMHNTRTGGICDGVPAISRCRQSLTVEALGWAEFGLCVFTVIATFVWVSGEGSEEGHDDRSSWRGSWLGSQFTRQSPRSMRQAQA